MSLRLLVLGAARGGAARWPRRPARSPQAAAPNTSPPGHAGQAHLHPPLDRPGLARGRPRRTGHRRCATTTTSSATPTTAGARPRSATTPTSATGGAGSAARRRRRTSTDLYAESGQHSSYSRLATDPGGPNEIVMFKSCFPNSQLSGAVLVPSRPSPTTHSRARPPGGAAFTVANAKGIYLDLLGYFGAHPEKLFVAVVAPPVTSPDTPGGRALANWLVDHWLQDSGYTAGNVLVFDFYTVLSSKTGGGDERRRARDAATTTASGTAPSSTRPTTAPTVSPTRPAATATPTPPATRRPRPSSSRCSTPPTTPGRATAGAATRRGRGRSRRARRR